MTIENYSISDARDLGRSLNNIMIFLTSGCVEDESILKSELEELMISKIGELEKILFEISDKS